MPLARCFGLGTSRPVGCFSCSFWVLAVLLFRAFPVFHLCSLVCPGSANMFKSSLGLKCFSPVLCRGPSALSGTLCTRWMSSAYGQGSPFFLTVWCTSRLGSDGLRLLLPGSRKVDTKAPAPKPRTRARYPAGKLPTYVVHQQQALRLAYNPDKGRGEGPLPSTALLW